ncbi:patatin-like phospholipase family protein [Microvirga sesbaniae]|uniref:patatin-like phospholipase family protein n=1 Tax=Microvirga sesbaniae TaxID=681392 RepID=UPI0021C7F533|nr:patatin-like phospholipase family protein [Microvirga sp. HBU67692]
MKRFASLIAIARRPRQAYTGRLAFRLLVLLAACAVIAYGVAGFRPPQRSLNEAAVPAAVADQITVLGLPNARFWAWYDLQGAALVQEWEQSLDRERAALGSPDGPLPPGSYLAISGGGGDGAFGAGLLCGWSDSGTMPAFKLVTGISTGAMIAPFAFLGGPYIERLRELYTTIKSQDEIRTLRALNGFYGMVFGEALADTSPLYRLISRYVDAQMLADIAAAYQNGRMLMIGTASLDQQRPIIWNLGAIAASGHPEALELTRKVILASASIPGAFPPVMINVDANGQRYQEMNVDAGVVQQALLYPMYFGVRASLKYGKFARERHAYIIRNARLDPDWASVNRDFLTITERAVATMIHYLGYNDVLRIYDMTKRDGIDYNLSYIETDFGKKKNDLFDPEYMKALFDYAYEKGRHRPVWHKAPPNLDFVPQLPLDARF